MIIIYYSMYTTLGELQIQADMRIGYISPKVSYHATLIIVKLT